MRGKGQGWQTLLRFLAGNQRLLWFLGLFLCGAAVGCTVFLSDVKGLCDILSPLLSPTLQPARFGDVCRKTAEICFPLFLLLLLLFLSGLSAFGALPSVAVPFFYGAGIGLSEAYFFAQGGKGVGYTALFILPHSLIVLAGLSMAAAESFRMSLLICRRLAPNGGSCGGLWRDLKLYLARYLLCAAVLFTAGSLQMILRLWFVKFFV